MLIVTVLQKQTKYIFTHSITIKTYYPKTNRKDEREKSVLPMESVK